MRGSYLAAYSATISGVTSMRGSCLAAYSATVTGVTSMRGSYLTAYSATVREGGCDLDGLGRRS